MSSLKTMVDGYFSKSALPYWIILLLDCFYVMLAGIVVFAAHYGLHTMYDERDLLAISLAVLLVSFIIGFRTLHTYDGVLRYSSFIDLLRIGLAVIIGTGLGCVAKMLTENTIHTTSVSYLDIIVTGLIVLVLMWITRIAAKNVYELAIRRSGRNNAVILGVKQGGVAIAKSLKTNETTPYRLVGFISPEKDMRSKRLMGLRVYQFNNDLPQLLRENGVRTLIVSPLMMDLLRDSETFVNSVIEAGIKIMVMPNACEWNAKSSLDLSTFTPVAVEDLLPRDEIEIDMKAAADLLTGNIVMITGAAGSIGSELVRQIAAYGPSQLVLIDQAETPMHDIRLMMAENWPGIKAETIVSDIADRRMMETLFERYRPQYVFHAAAYKHVPMMEDNPYEAVINNIEGTVNIADMAVKYGTRKFVMVSTDKAVNPTNVMGCSKRICEIYVQSLDKAIKEKAVEGSTRFITTRFGNVLGSNGSVIPIFQKQILKGGPVTVTHPDIIRFFMLIPEACRLVIEAGTMGDGGEIFVFDMGKPVRIADLARRMIKLSGRPDIEIRYTGLRDGEKLYEEVLTDEEVAMPTFHSKIRIAKVREYPFADVSATIADLVKSAPEDDDMHIVARMKAIVPEFKSKHSKFEALDK